MGSSCRLDRGPRARWGLPPLIACVLAGMSAAAPQESAMRNLRAAGRCRSIALQRMKEGNYVSAASTLRIATEYRPDDPAIRLDLLVALFASGRLYEAAEVLERWHIGFTSEILDQAKTVSRFPSERQFEQALARLAEMHRNLPRDLELCRLLGFIDRLAGRAEEAQSLFTDVLAQDASDPVALHFAAASPSRPIAPYLVLSEASRRAHVVSDAAAIPVATPTSAARPAKTDASRAKSPKTSPMKSDAARASTRNPDASKAPQSTGAGNPAVAPAAKGPIATGAAAAGVIATAGAAVASGAAPAEQGRAMDPYRPSPLPPNVCFPALRERVSLAGD